MSQTAANILVSVGLAFIWFWFGFLVHLVLNDLQRRFDEEGDHVFRGVGFLAAIFFICLAVSALAVAGGLFKALG